MINYYNTCVRSVRLFRRQLLVVTLHILYAIKALCTASRVRPAISFRDDPVLIPRSLFFAFVLIHPATAHPTRVRARTRTEIIPFTPVYLCTAYLTSGEHPFGLLSRPQQLYVYVQQQQPVDRYVRVRENCDFCYARDVADRCALYYTSYKHGPRRLYYYFIHLGLRRYANNITYILLFTVHAREYVSNYEHHSSRRSSYYNNTVLRNDAECRCTPHGRVYTQKRYGPTAGKQRIDVCLRNT